MRVFIHFLLFLLFIPVSQIGLYDPIRDPKLGILTQFGSFPNWALRLSLGTLIFVVFPLSFVDNFIFMLLKYVRKVCVAD